jgi:cystathionine beta-lyase
MAPDDISTRVTANAQAVDPASLRRHFGGRPDVLPLWIAEPYVDLAPEIHAALRERSAAGWYGYETRPAAIAESFWSWMQRRHGWKSEGLITSVSPSVGTSIGALIDHHTDTGDGVLMQPPVFTDFKPLVRTARRDPVRNSLTLVDGHYRMDFDDLEARAADPAVRAMILCNPHNPVGRVWNPAELQQVAEICAEHDVLVIADEIHADLVLAPHTFTPFGPIAAAAGTRWAAIHGPIKTFGLAGVCDTLLITDDEAIAQQFGRMSSQFHLTRNNVFGLAALEAAYGSDGGWLDGLLELTASNAALLADQLPDPLNLIQPEGTYLAWLDFRKFGLDVPELAEWLWSAAGLALSPGHWFGREGAGFARMTIAAPQDTIVEAIARLTRAVAENH